MASRNQHPKRQANRPSRSAVVRPKVDVLVRTDYQDDDGRWWAVLVPEGRQGDASMGIPIGPPDLTPLGLPTGIEIRLHNELFHRGLLTQNNLKGRAREVFAALQAALHVDVATVTGLYR